MEVEPIVLEAGAEVETAAAVAEVELMAVVPVDEQG